MDEHHEFLFLERGVLSYLVKYAEVEYLLSDGHLSSKSWLTLCLHVFGKLHALEAQ